MRLYGWVFGAVFGIFAVSATFCQVFSGFLAGFGCCFGDFCSFNYFFSGFFRLLGWVWGAVLVISAVSATFCEASGIMVEAQHHKLTTTYWKKPLVSFNIKNTVIRNGNLYEPGPPAYTYVNLPLPCVHAGAFLRFMSIISYRILVTKRSEGESACLPNSPRLTYRPTIDAQKLRAKNAHLIPCLWKMLENKS